MRSNQSATYNEIVLLFLDFDGVLHPVGCNTEELFCHLRKLEEVIREYPGVRIVISSSWQSICSLDELKKLFSIDITDRVIGVTGKCEGKLRYVEIANYLEQQALEDIPWVALDDNVFAFPSNCTNFVRCNGETGLTSEVTKTLRDRLGELVSKTAIERGTKYPAN